MCTCLNVKSTVCALNYLEPVAAKLDCQKEQQHHKHQCFWLSGQLHCDKPTSCSYHGAPNACTAKKARWTQQNARRPNFRRPIFLQWALFLVTNDEVFDRSDSQPASVHAAVIMPVTMEMVTQHDCLIKWMEMRVRGEGRGPLIKRRK